MTDKPAQSFLERNPCLGVSCPERIDCCTSVRWRITERDYHDPYFREWWLLHEGARLVSEDGSFFMQWPMRCRNVSEDGLRCLDYENRPYTCRMYVCKRMTQGETE